MFLDLLEDSGFRCDDFRVGEERRPKALRLHYRSRERWCARGEWRIMELVLDSNRTK